MNLRQFFTTVTPFSKSLALALFVCLPFAGFYLGHRYNLSSDITRLDQLSEISAPSPTNIPLPVVDPIGSWVKPISGNVIIPIIKEDKLFIYSPFNKKLAMTNYKTSWGSGASGLGGDSPLASPNGKLIAFINRGDSSNLYLMSDNQKAVKITNYPVLYLNSWSSDGSKILFYSSKDDLAFRKFSEMGGGPAWETVEKFPKNFTSGFHSFNVNDGQDTHLYPISTAEAFMDSNRVIVKLSQDESSSKTRFVLFNVDSFEADYASVSYAITSFSQQMSFTQDGKHWARTVDDGGTSNGVKIVVSQFPSEIGDVVDTASWAFIQKPLLNPSGKFLAYTKKGEQIKDGQYAGQYSDTTVIWDSSSKKIIKQLSGFPEYWVDENTLLIGRTQYGSNLSNFSSFDLVNPLSDQVDSFSVK